MSSNPMTILRFGATSIPYKPVFKHPAGAVEPLPEDFDVWPDTSSEETLSKPPSP